MIWLASFRQPALQAGANLPPRCPSPLFFARDINNGVEPVLQGIVLFLQRLVLTFKLVNPSFSLSIILLSVLAGTAGRWARAEVVGRSGIGTLFSKTEPSREWVQVVSGSRPDNATFSIPVTIY